MKRLSHDLQLATELGLTMGLMAAGWTLLGLWLGTRLDRALGTEPIATLFLLLAGAAAGQLSILRLVARVRPGLGADVRHAFGVSEGLGAARTAVVLLALLVLPVSAGLLLGVWLDRQAGTGSLLTLLLALLGLASGFYGAIRVARKGHGGPTTTP